MYKNQINLSKDDPRRNKCSVKRGSEVTEFHSYTGKNNVVSLKLQRKIYHLAAVHHLSEIRVFGLSFLSMNPFEWYCNSMAKKLIHFIGFAWLISRKLTVVNVSLCLLCCFCMLLLVNSSENINYQGNISLTVKYVV